MSATGRSDVRVENDQYATPPWCVHVLLEELKLPGGAWLEPCAGAGAIIDAVNMRRRDVAWTAVELDAKYQPRLELTGADVKIVDFLKAPFMERPYPPLFVASVLNPPYSIAEEVIRRCQKLAGITVALVRINFLASKQRAAWMRGWTPDIYVLPNRPSFTGKGTDATEYCWAVWDWRRVSGRGKIQILREASKAERKEYDATTRLGGA